ncbi:MAG: ABC transporter ATP-binding protein [Catonella sp.]|uniref:ABC transporter ATP-binding protein n=1 Tax=Catonella sp. TaxID=2382125 RepID=UPI003FA18E25
MKVLKNHVGQIIFSVLMAIVGVGFSIIPYYALADLVVKMMSAEVISGESVFANYHYVNDLALILAGLILSIIFHEISTLTSHNLAFRIIESERKRLVGKLGRLSMGEIEKKSSGQWSQFMVETLDKLEQPIAHVIPEVLANIIIPIVIVVIIFTLDWRIGVANLLTLPVGFLFSTLMMSGYAERSKRYQEASKAMNTSIVEYIRGIQVIKAFNKSASSYGKFREAVNNNRDAMLDWYLHVCFATTAAMDSLPSTLVFVLPVTLYLYMTGSINISVVVMGMLLSYASYRPLIKAMSHADTMANVGVILNEINKVMDMPELERGDKNLEISSFDVRFDNVSFGYDSEKKVFENLTFTAKEKELTAIVGYSGGGKSTIAKLVAGFWNVNSGHIYIGDADLSQMPLSQNMDLVTYVSQENFLFRKSILENMRFAKADATLEEVQEACKKASCHDFIMSLENGYDTVVGDSGDTLSGGERQRITIARALLKDSPIVLLDEATAYSDPDNEAEIQKSINELIKSKTVIMIAHRLSTIINADNILVMDRGKLTAQGTHRELLETSHIYKELWEAHIGETDKRREK